MFKIFRLLLAWHALIPRDQNLKYFKALTVIYFKLGKPFAKQSSFISWLECLLEYDSLTIIPDQQPSETDLDTNLSVQQTTS